MEKRNHSTFCRRKSNFVFLVFTLMLLFWAGHAEVVSAFVAPPVVWPDEGTYASRLNVVVSAPGAGIKYTKDETDPCTPSAMDYTRPIELNTLDSSSIILKTCAFVGTEFSSPVAKQYNMIGDRLAKITTENEAYDMMVNAGSDFVAVVQMRSFSSSIGKMDVGLTFDPVKLRLDAIEAVAGFTIPGAIIIDNISGSGFAAIESVGQQDFLGHTSVAILRFHALDQISGSAPISLDTATTVAHDYAQQNEQVLTYWEGLNVTIEGAADITAPTILSIVRHNPTQENVSNGTSATFRITFSEDVANVDISDFVLSGTGASATVQLGGAGTLTPVSASTYDFSLPSAYPGTLSLAVNGPQNIQDLAGNAYVTASPIPTNEQYVVSDTTAPTVTAFSLPAVANSLTVDIVTFAVTDNVGVSQYLITESATVPSVSDGGWNSSVPDSFTFATAGLKTLYAWAKDAAGNVSASKSATVTIDTAAPVIREVSPVPSLTANRRPSYTFNSTEAGTIVYGGDCSSQTTTTAAGNNLIELDSLAAGGSRIYSNCTIQVFDQALNASNVLNMSVFSTDFTPPAISSGFPSGALSVGTVQTTIRVVTSEYAECRYAQFSRNGGFPSSEYFSKSTGMTTENGTDHISVVAGLANGGSYNYYITCFDNLENYNATDYSISFSVANSSTSSGDGGGGSSHKKTTTSPRTISHSKNTVKKGDTLIQRGKKFSKKSPVLLYFGKIGGGYYAPQRVMTSTTGAFSVSYKVNKPAGRYPWYVLDVKTNKKSKIKYYTVR